MYPFDLLTLFNTVVPKDGASFRSARGVPYGEERRQKLDVYRPKRGPRNRPTIVFFYGGAWDSGHRQGYGFVARALAAKGFVVIVPDYRLVPKVHYPAFVEDGAAAVRWARRYAGTAGGDGERIILIGHSAGAYIAAMLALDSRWLGDAHKAVRGFAGLAGPYDFLPLDDPASIAAFGGWPDLAETQPVAHAGTGAPPTLLLHGDADTRVKPRHSVALDKALREAGCDVTLKLYPGVDHARILTSLAMPLRRRVPVFDDLTAFVKGTKSRQKTDESV